LTDFIPVIGERSGDVTYNLYSGESAEEAYSASSFATGTIVAGVNPHIRPRVRGTALLIKLSNSSNVPWTYERITAILQSAGTQRI